jgi:hypothetical protein
MPTPRDNANAAEGVSANTAKAGSARQPPQQSNKRLFLIIGGIVAGLGLCCSGTCIVGIIIAYNNADEFRAGFKKGLEAQQKAAKARENVPPVPVPDQGEVKPKGPAFLLEKKDKLMPSEKRHAGAPGPSKEYKVKLQQGTRYLIGMQREGASSLTPYLRLLDAKGKELAMSTNVSGDLAASIEFTAPETAEYTVQASANPKGPLASLGPLPADGAGFRVTVRETK